MNNSTSTCIVIDDGVCTTWQTQYDRVYDGPSYYDWATYIGIDVFFSSMIFLGIIAGLFKRKK